MSVTIDVAIIGAGAAGLMCAIEAGKRGRRAVVFEHGPRAGRKILISGGGRCNFTNLDTRADNFLSENPHFAKSALARYGPQDFLKLVERHGIKYHQKTLGQLFCDGSAREILDMLEAECASAGVRIETSCAVHKIARESGWQFDTPRGAFEAASLVIATGGLSIPKLGATPFGYGIAEQFGLAVVAPRPALVPLIFSREDRERFGGLQGVSADAAVTAGGRTFREKLLFTHQGLSGPSILQASSYRRPGQPVEIDLLPGIDLAGQLREQRTSPQATLGRHLAKRLADRWFVGPKRGASLSDREIQAIADSLHRWQVCPAGTEGYEKAEVTAGGVDTAELSSKTFEAKKAPGLYFIGEVVDVTGQLGGFNFQWAWASGFCAGQVV